MADTLKSFIDKLQAQGVESGEQAAKKICDEAQAEAKTIVSDAEAKAKEIIAAAQAQCDSMRTKTENELKLSARDTISKLQETLIQGLQGVINVAIREKLTDTDFLGNLIYDVVMQYVKADLEDSYSITINVTDDMRHKLADWAIKKLHGQAAPKNVDLKGTLHKAGFEYHVTGGVVEVTAESATEVLVELLGPEVRDIVAKAIATGK